MLSTEDDKDLVLICFSLSFVTKFATGLQLHVFAFVYVNVRPIICLLH